MSAHLAKLSPEDLLPGKQHVLEHFWDQFPRAVRATYRICCVCKVIWQTVFNWQRWGEWKNCRLSVKRLAEETGLSLKTVYHALERLERVGMLRVTRTVRNEEKFLELQWLWPAWLEAEAERFRMSTKTLDLKEGAGELEPPSPRKPPEYCTNVGYVKVRKGVGKIEKPSIGKRVGVEDNAVDCRDRVKSVKDPLPKTTEAKPPRSEIAPREKRLLPVPVEEDLHGTPDPNSPSGEKLRCREEEVRAARRRATGREVAPEAPLGRRAPSGLEFTERPSARWEWSETARPESGPGLVGYWVRRYREVNGIEDPDFFVDSLADAESRISMKNALRCFRYQLHGKLDEWRAAVEKVLALPETGPPRRLRYWFLPTFSRQLEDLMAGKRGGHKETLCQVNDRDAANLPAWRQRVAGSGGRK